MNRTHMALGAMGIAGALLLTGCGGGGGNSSSGSGGSSTSTPTAVQMQAALNKYAQNGTTNHFTVSGWIGVNGQQANVSGSGVVTISPPQSNGTETETVSVTANGTTYSDTLNVAIPFASAPISVSAGQSGSFGGATYTVTADGPDAVLVTINASGSASSGGNSAQGQLQFVYKIDTSNNVTLVSSQIQESLNGTEVLDIALTF